MAARAIEVSIMHTNQSNRLRVAIKVYQIWLRYSQSRQANCLGRNKKALRCSAGHPFLKKHTLRRYFLKRRKLQS